MILLREIFSFVLRIYLSFYLHCMVPPIMLRCRNLQPFFLFVLINESSTKLLVGFIDMSSLLTATPMRLSCCLCFSFCLPHTHTLSFFFPRSLTRHCVACRRKICKEGDLHNEIIRFDKELLLFHELIFL